MVNDDPGLPDPLAQRIRYQVELTNRQTGEVEVWSVNYGEASGRFGVVKPAGQ